MNHHQRHLPPGVNRALRSFLLLLLALIAPRELLAMPRLHQSKTKTSAAKTKAGGYLLTVGAPALRFQDNEAVPSTPQTANPSTPAFPVSALPERPADTASVPLVAAVAPATADPKAATNETHPE